MKKLDHPNTVKEDKQEGENHGSTRKTVNEELTTSRTDVMPDDKVIPSTLVQ